MKSVLVTGASGAIGPSVVESLHKAGCRVRVLSIYQPPIGVLPGGTELVVGDITNAPLVRSAMREIDTVIHMAALLHRVNPPPEMRKEYERVNVGGTRTVVEAATHAGVNRLVFFSTIAVYGSSSNVTFSEEIEPRPQTMYAETKLTGERIVLEMGTPGRQRLGTVLRLAAVYGSRVKGNYERLVHAIARGRFVPIGTGQNRRTLIYVKDVARAALLAATHPNAPGRIFNITDGAFHTMQEIINVVSASLGRKPPRLRLPVAPVYFIAGLSENCCRLLRCRPPVERMTLAKYVEDLAVSGDRAQAELGFTPEYDLVRGWRETVRDMRKAEAIR